MSKKFFRVAQEGQTTDGRVIERKWLTDIAETYDPQKYGARINMEHVRGLLPDSPFKSYGDVLAVKVEDNAEGKAELFAQLDPTADLIAFNKARQKVYTSIEIDPDFAGTGKCGLVGLAVTDSPASLGTDYLVFHATTKSQDAHPMAGRKQKPRNVFSSAALVALDFGDETADAGSDEAAKTFMGMLSKAFSLLGGQQTPTPPVNQAPQVPAPAGLGAFSADLKSALETFAATSTAQVKALHDALDAFKKTAVSREDFDALRDQLDKTDRNFRQRPPATGGNGELETDC
ncbi:Phage capsid scaffolding protein (GPO) serine peptidase [Bordetella ansorpii]|uniref:Phage capsid scaffolding protein (GPO) serine peptidase n=1 Tax=Bordetella ansorpii TaxID=288768 RepID=A0A157QND1_9BORD|nr:GPO family capsid scaffolding protein [Bordetella ansorpii]SAI47385.1 Phage capsid scaffolding protein (GPO) serine peptidase [Bordetella ansorpii]